MPHFYDFSQITFNYCNICIYFVFIYIRVQYVHNIFVMTRNLLWDEIQSPREPTKTTFVQIKLRLVINDSHHFHLYGVQ